MPWFVTWMKRSLLAPIAACLAACAVSLDAGSLDDHRGKHRLLVIPGTTETIEAELEKNRSGIKERDIRVIRPDNESSTAIDREIAGKFHLTAVSREILLIGKDGRTTVRWPHKKFTIAQLFARIDAMPMRRREMRKP